MVRPAVGAGNPMTGLPESFESKRGTVLFPRPKIKVALARFSGTCYFPFPMDTANIPIAVLWDESHLWGVLVLRALQASGLAYDILCARDVAEGALKQKYTLLLVPGGWARLKGTALGKQGRSAVRTFLREGGSYLGFCGGAGLALSAGATGPLLNLCPWDRKPMRDRLPNFSGHVRSVTRTRPGGPETMRALPVWWPSQFAENKEDGVQVLARYVEPDTDFWSADLPLTGMDETTVREWEKVYGINLHREKIVGDPCVVTGSIGRGRYILSYAHLETPDSPEANDYFMALLREMIPELKTPEKFQVPAWAPLQTPTVWHDAHLSRMGQSLQEIITHGREHFLFSKRLPWLLGWRRGIPGSAINFLHGMVAQAAAMPPEKSTEAFWASRKEELCNGMQRFKDRVNPYLIRERQVMATGVSSPEASSCPDLQREKEELFGKFPGYGGMYGDLLQGMDMLLWTQFTGREPF